jgi:AraC-like DNA-binding protein
MPLWLRRFYFLVLIDVALIGGMFICQPFDFYTGMFIFWMLLILSILATTFIAFRAPETYRLIESNAAKIRYRKPRLSDESADRALSNLGTIMKVKKLYRDPDLSLEYLASSISMNGAQLSELLNLHQGQSFTAYVNGFRIEHAKTALLEKPGTSILDIAFECGFNSKSTFNAAFKSSTGITPSKFRDKAVKP